MAPAPPRRAPRRAPPAALALALALALAAAPPAAALPAITNCCVNFGSGGGPAGVTCSPGCSVADTSVQAAIDSASPGAVVWLNAGDYKAGININKPLTLRGAKWDVRAGPEALPAGRAVNSGCGTDASESAFNIGGVGVIAINADDVTVEGVYVSPSIRVADGALRAVVRNCIVCGNQDAISLDGSGPAGSGFSVQATGNWMTGQNSGAGVRFRGPSGSDKALQTAMISANYMYEMSQAVVMDGGYTSPASGPGPAHLLANNLVEGSKTRGFVLSGGPAGSFSIKKNSFTCIDPGATAIELFPNAGTTGAAGSGYVGSVDIQDNYFGTWPGTSQNCVWDAAVLIRGAAPAASIAIHNNAFKDALTAIRLDGYLGSAPTGVSFSVAADLNAWGPPNTAVLESQLKPRINVGPYSQAAVKYLPYYVTYSGKFGPPQPGFVPQGYTVQGDPHFVGFDGTPFFFNGWEGGVFNLLSERSHQVNALFGSVGPNEGKDSDVWMIGLGFRVGQSLSLTIKIDADPASIKLYKDKTRGKRGRKWRVRLPAGAFSAELNGARCDQLIGSGEAARGLPPGVSVYFPPAGAVHPDDPTDGPLLVVRTQLLELTAYKETEGAAHLDLGVKILGHVDAMHGVLGQTYGWVLRGDGASHVTGGVLAGDDGDFAVEGGLLGSSFKHSLFDSSPDALSGGAPLAAGLAAAGRGQSRRLLQSGGEGAPLGAGLAAFASAVGAARRAA